MGVWACVAQALSFGVYMLLGAWIMSQGLTPDKNNTAASVAFFAQTLSLLHFERTLAVMPFDALLRVLSAPGLMAAQ